MKTKKKYFVMFFNKDGNVEDTCLFEDYTSSCEWLTKCGYHKLTEDNTTWMKGGSRALSGWIYV